jgi:hypothetical protein
VGATPGEEKDKETGVVQVRSGVWLYLIIAEQSTAESSAAQRNAAVPDAGE